ncbi:MAG: Rpn family recombination-promoting nuclease/putative transposase [Alkalinema sp. RU_4_3]|nr:Rpn family recombination-promoting nuclease/putative transposase [Alkalinema sp. RU_4_3]
MASIFINPKTDFAFKKIFGSEQSHDILVSFLNGILYAGESVIEDLEILNPYQAPRIRGVKDTYLDVKAKLFSGQTVIIEMQVLNIEGFEKRILYNAAKAYSIQLSQGDQYKLLNPVIALTITDFTMFSEFEAVISRFVLKEKDYLVDYPSCDLELVFVELPKFKQTLEQIDTLTEKWMYFMQHTRELEAIPAIMGEVPAIRQAFEVANQANLNRDELEELEHQSIFIQDQRNAISLANRQGREKGREEGALSMQKSIAINLLSTMDNAAIASLTGLTIEAVEALRSGNH